MSLQCASVVRNINSIAGTTRAADFGNLANDWQRQVVPTQYLRLLSFQLYRNINIILYLKPLTTRYWREQSLSELRNVEEYIYIYIYPRSRDDVCIQTYVHMLVDLTHEHYTETNLSHSCVPCSLAHTYRCMSYARRHKLLHSHTDYSNIVVTLQRKSNTVNSSESDCVFSIVK